MIVLWWRIRFMFAVSWILRDMWWKNRKLYLTLGWVVSRGLYSDMSPYKSALKEITRWYCE